MAKKKNAVRADGRIAVQVYLGTVDGRRKYKTVYGKTQKEADEKALQVKLLINKGIDISSRCDSFSLWADAWLRIKATEVSFGRLESYRYHLKKFEPISEIEIAKLKTADFQKIILEFAKRNPTTGHPTAQATLKDIRSAALQVCRLAVENRVMDYNPVEAVKIPRIAPVMERRALTAAEQAWIIETPHRAQTAAMIMMYAGLRRGELLALTWNDIDFKNKAIDINKSVAFVEGKPFIKDSAKTRNSIRTIDIPDVLVEYLAKVKCEPHSSLLLCPSAKGQLMGETGWRRLWDSYLTDLNLKYGDFSNQLSGKPKSKFQPKQIPFLIPRFTAHWLRHTFATILYFAGVDILTAKEQLGHADIQTTLNIYTHLDNKFKRKSMDKLNNYLSEKTC